MGQRPGIILFSVFVPSLIGDEPVVLGGLFHGVLHVEGPVPDARCRFYVVHAHHEKVAELDWKTEILLQVAIEAT